MTWWARWRKRTCLRCACVYFVSWETGTSRKLCIYLRERKAVVGRGSIKQFLTDLFTDTVAILNLLDLRSIIGCPKGHSLSIYGCFLGKKRTSLYISRENGDRSLLHPTRRAQRSFFPIRLQSFSRKTWRKIGPKSARKYWCEYMRSCSCPLGIP